MKKTIYITVLLVFLLSIGFAQEITLASQGYSTLTAEGENNRKCETYELKIAEHDLLNDKFPIFSIKAQFFPVTDESARITLNFNDSGLVTVWAEDFTCGEECWARPTISKSRLSENTTLQICAYTTDITDKINVFAESKLGFYETPIFTIEKVSPGTIFIGEKAEMKIIAKNLGSKDANVFIQFISPTGKRVVKIDGFDIVEGESTATAVISVGETREFVYYIKPTLESSYNLPAAVLFFENVFGEEQHMYSDHPILYVEKPERLEAFLVGSSPENNAFTFKVVVKNLWGDVFDGQLRVSHEEHVEGALSQITIPANGEKEILFITNTLPTGKYNFFATVEDENSSAVSNAVTFSIENESVPEEMFFALVGIIVAVVLFVIIFVFGKKPRTNLSKGRRFFSFCFH